MNQKKFWNDNALNWAQVIEKNLIASRTVTNQAIINEIISLNPETVLDMGCGEGWLEQPLMTKNIQYTGVDVSQNLITIAQQKGTGTYSCASYEQIAKGQWNPNQKFDAIVFNFSLLDEHLTVLLKQTSTFLKSNGRIVIQTLNPKNLSIYKDGWNEEDFKTMTIQFSGKMPWYGRTLESWNTLFEDSGLKIEETVEPVQNGKPVSIIFRCQAI